MSPPDKIEHFFLIGVMRSGTTYLAALLDEHPGACMARPILPEPKYFLNAENFDKEPDHYYKKFFSHRHDEKILGEKTVHYSEREDGLERIHRRFPDAKILILLRNPLERALSNYYFSLKNGLETRSLEEVFIKKTKAPLYNRDRFFISPFDYLERGKYINHISLARRHFPSKNIKIIFHEELINNGEEVKEIYRFLNLDPEFTPPSLKKKIYANGNNTGDAAEVIREAVKKFFSPWNVELEEALQRPLPWERKS